MHNGELAKSTKFHL